MSSRYTSIIDREIDAILADGGSDVSRAAIEVLAGGESYDTKKSDAIRNATGDKLRVLIPVDLWKAGEVHLIELDDGILRVASRELIEDEYKERLLHACKRAGLEAEDLEEDLWDQRALIEALRTTDKDSADDIEANLRRWSDDLDNGVFLAAFKQSLLAQAADMRASDIHMVMNHEAIDPCWIDFRVDGDLRKMHVLRTEAMGRLITTLKTAAGLDSGNRSVPMDGRMGFKWQGRYIDIRVATVPHGMAGEKMTLRLLDRATLKSFNELFAPTPYVRNHLDGLLNPAIKGGGGVILVSGPTGSGKTTTLYGMIQHIDRRTQHVFTIDDPIEYQIRYATQVQVVEGMKGRDFADLLRSALRQDPDFVVPSELRDQGSVETAIRACQSGHTVLSTVHADNAPQTLDRILNMLPVGQKAASISTLSHQLKAVLNQRLLKTLCRTCSHHSTARNALNQVELNTLGLSGDEPIKIAREGGCEHCNHTGYAGRRLLLEALLFSPKTNEDYLAIFDTMSEGKHELLADLSGVTHLSRAASLSGMVRSREIDPRFALRILGE